MGSKVFRETFKNITCDNGCENLDFEGIEKSCLTNIQRTKVYYAHPYNAWERDSNENVNERPNTPAMLGRIDVSSSVKDIIKNPPVV